MVNPPYGQDDDDPGVACLKCCHSAHPHGPVRRSSDRIRPSREDPLWMSKSTALSQSGVG